MMENFLFLLIVILLQLVALKTKIPLVKIIFGVFGILFSAMIQSDVAYPYFNMLSFFISIVTMINATVELR